LLLIERTLHNVFSISVVIIMYLGAYFCFLYISHTNLKLICMIKIIKLFIFYLHAELNSQEPIRESKIMLIIIVTC
jgi:hypothetical protein